MRQGGSVWKKARNYNEAKNVLSITLSLNSAGSLIVTKNVIISLLVPGLRADIGFPMYFERM